MNKESKKGLLLAILGTVFFSTSPIFTRMVHDIPSQEIAFFRMFLGSLFIFIAAKIYSINLRLAKDDVLKFTAYGIIAALHFLFYIKSVIYTTIAHSLSLVYTAPIMITLLSGIILKEKIPKKKYIGIFVVILGIIVLAGFEPLLTKKMILGDVFALLSALCLALYSLAGRRERDSYPLLKYVFWVYFISAIFLFILSAKNFILPMNFNQWLPLILLGLLPTTLGHTLYNAGIRYIHPTYANLISTQEVTGGVILGIILLKEIPSLNSIIGIIIMFLGLYSVLSDVK